MQHFKQCPQGTVLGPLLFNLYIDDMHEQVDKTELIPYADDTAIFTSGDSIEKKQKPALIMCYEINHLFQRTSTEFKRIKNWVYSF